MIKKIIPVLVIIGIFLPNLAFFQVKPISPPQTLEEAKEIGIKAEKEIKLNFAGILKKIWNFVKKLWQKITTPFKKEFERRKPIIEEEFKKEKQEMKEEIKTELPKTGKSLWERFKELIK